jgi:hypothetical protein
MKEVAVQGTVGPRDLVELVIDRRAFIINIERAGRV